jgi:hypothetical protein
MISKLLYLASCLFAITTATIKDCSNGNSIFEITELALTPDPPIKGKELYMTVKFDNPNDEISEGSVTTSVTLNFIPFQPSIKTLCDSTQCPIMPGSNDRSTSSVWPDTVSGTVSSKIVWNTPDGFELLCIQITAKIAAESTKNLRFRESYNQTHADLIADLLDLNDPVPLSELEDDLAPYDEDDDDKCYIWDTPKELVVWTNLTNALLSPFASNTSDRKSN